MSSIEVENPILCSPFAEPGEHWRIEDGRMPERRSGRRPAGYWHRDLKAPEPEAGFTRVCGWRWIARYAIVHEMAAVSDAISGCR